MTSPTQTEPPGAPPRRSGWATNRTPRWVFAVIALAVVGVALVSLSHKPSPSQRASDLAGYFKDVQAGIGSCAAGLHDSENAYGQLLSGKATLDKNAESVFTYGGANCTLASNEALSDFGNYQVTESLSSFNLDAADNDVITWSFGASQAQADMLAVLQATSPAARGRAQATLSAALSELDHQRAAVNAIWNSAKAATGATAAPPALPAWTPQLSPGGRPPRNPPVPLAAGLIAKTPVVAGPPPTTKSSGAPYPQRHRSHGPSIPAGHTRYERIVAREKSGR